MAYTGGRGFVGTTTLVPLIRMHSIRLYPLCNLYPSGVRGVVPGKRGKGTDICYAWHKHTVRGRGGVCAYISLLCLLTFKVPWYDGKLTSSRLKLKIYLHMLTPIDIMRNPTHNFIAFM